MWPRGTLLGAGRASGAASGPLDGLSNIEAIYSLRRLLGSYSGDCLKLRRSSDDAESDFGFDGSGIVDTAAIATWLGGGSGYVTTWYDQSGNESNATQATDADQPLYEASGLDSKPTLYFNSDFLACNGVASVFSGLNTASSVLSVAKVSVADVRIFAAGGSGDYHEFGSFVGNLYLTAKEDGTPDFDLIQSVNTLSGNGEVLSYLNNSSGTIIRNGVQIATGPYIYAATALVCSFAGIGCLARSEPFTAASNHRISEIVVMSDVVSATDHNTIGENMSDYYGFSWTTVV